MPFLEQKNAEPALRGYRPPFGVDIMLLRSWFKNGSLSLWLLAAAAISLAVPTAAHGQLVQQAVGGILIDADGMLRQMTADQQTELLGHMRRELVAVPADLTGDSTVRKISLRKLNEQLHDSLEAGKQIPDEIRYLAGLQRVEYVAVLPEAQDIVLIGPGGGWHVTDTGAVVSTATKRPVILLDDLIVAMRSASGARQTAISCSIDPTAEGRVALNKFLSKQKRFHKRILAQAKKIMGPQQITLTGVSKDSHFAQVLVAADYRMKRIAMHLEPSPVDEIPSFLELAKKRRGAVSDLMPRWWLACDYEPLARSEDGLTWQIRGSRVKAMTEDQIIHADGSVEQTGKTNPVAEEWATTMTENYEQLSLVEPVFGQLQNVMDLSVVAALIQHQNLLEKANCGNLPMLTTQAGDGALTRWEVPSWVATESSVMKNGRSFILTASGGVQLDPWYFASRSEVSPEIQEIRDGVGQGNNWRWD